MVARAVLPEPPRTAAGPASRLGPRFGPGLATIGPVSTGLKAVLLALVAALVAREIMFRRNLKDFDPATAPYGD